MTTTKYSLCVPGDDPSEVIDTLGIDTDDLQALIEESIDETFHFQKIVFQDETTLIVDVYHDAEGENTTRLIFWKEEE